MRVYLCVFIVGVLVQFCMYILTVIIPDMLATNQRHSDQGRDHERGKQKQLSDIGVPMNEEPRSGYIVINLLVLQ